MTFTKHKIQTTSASLLLSTLLISPLAMAEQTAITTQPIDSHETPQELAQNEAHQHGAARLSIVIDEDDMEIVLQSPAINLFGFENQPGDGAEEAVIFETVELLEDDDALFRMPKDAGCVLHNFEIESPIVKMDDDEDSDKDINEQATDSVETESAHSDVEALWNFSCKNTAELKRLEVKFFAAFPDRFKKLDVEWISPVQSSQLVLDGDGAILLTPSPIKR